MLRSGSPDSLFSDQAFLAQSETPSASTETPTTAAQATAAVAQRATAPIADRTRPATSQPAAASPASANTRVKGEEPRVFNSITPGVLPPTEWSVPREVEADRIYSDADEDVTAPEPLRSYRLDSLGTALQADEIVTIEYVVNEEGNVQMAKATVPPRTVGESLFLAAGLHAMKSWRFRPALKNGSPVPYRGVVTFEATEP
jgi:hypothetical protein